MECDSLSESVLLSQVTAGRKRAKYTGINPFIIIWFHFSEADIYLQMVIGLINK